jgi:hypothetical protein
MGYDHEFKRAVEIGSLTRSLHTMRTVPISELYKHAHKPKYIVQHMCVHKGAGYTTSWGRLEHLSEEDVQTRGLQIILRDLDEFASRDSDVGAETNGLTLEAKKARRLLRDYWHVSICLRPGPALELNPICETGRDSGIGYPEDRVTVSLPCTQETFLRILQDAFERCCVIKNR